MKNRRKKPCKSAEFLEIDEQVKHQQGYG